MTTDFTSQGLVHTIEGAANVTAAESRYSEQLSAAPAEDLP